jgi:aldehyde:ferredoxin oxidoreductase
MPASARLHVSGKSPLTNGLGSSNIGGAFGAKLRAAGFLTLIIKGKSEKPVYLYIESGNATLRDAQTVWGQDTQRSIRSLHEKLGSKDIEALVIGPAGENQVPFATIMTEGGHAAGRTGMGAVMGSKNLKAVAVKSRIPKISPSPQVKAAVKEYYHQILSAPRYKLFSKMSNTFVVGWAHDKGILSTRNFLQGTFSGTKRIDGTDMLEHVVKRKNCHRCPVHCRAEFKINSGPYAGSSGERPDLEPTISLGSKCGLDDSDAILYLHNLCNRLGIDALSTGGVIAFAMEAFEKGILTLDDLDGIDLTWGNAEAMEKCIRLIARRKGPGEILSQGVCKAADAIGRGADRFAYHCKGLELTGFDPRGLMACALGYAISTRGGDFTSVYALPETKWSSDKCRAYFGTHQAADRFSTKGKGNLVKHSALVSAVIDSLGICKVPALSLLCEFDLKREAELTTLLTGWSVDAETLLNIGERIFNIENLFNTRQGDWEQKESLPDRFQNIPLRDGTAKGHTVDIHTLLQDFYTSMGWDAHGRPTTEKLRDLGLLDIFDREQSPNRS